MTFTKKPLIVFGAQPFARTDPNKPSFYTRGELAKAKSRIMSNTQRQIPTGRLPLVLFVFLRRLILSILLHQVFLCTIMRWKIAPKKLGRE